VSDSATGFKPSSIVLSTPPLTGTMRKTEVECAAGLLVWALAQTGDTWRALPAKELGALVTSATQAKDEPVASWARNPFMRPDFARLIELGFAERSGEAPNEAIAFTPAGLAAMRPWVALPSTAPPTATGANQ
jgi:hypothetical protein